MTSVRTNEVRLQLSVLACNPGNLWRRLVLPKRIDTCSLTSLQQRLVRTAFGEGGRYYLLLPAEGHLNRRLFGATLQQICATGPRRADGRRLTKSVRANKGRNTRGDREMLKMSSPRPLIRLGVAGFIMPDRCDKDIWPEWRFTRVACRRV